MMMKNDAVADAGGKDEGPKSGAASPETAAVLITIWHDMVYAAGRRLKALEP